MNKYSLFTIILYFFLFNGSHALEKVTIKYKVNNFIITNTDIQNEVKYLTALNNQLKNLDKDQLNKIASTSILKEKIKFIGIGEVIDPNQGIKYLDQVIKNFYITLGLNDEQEFKEYLKEYNLTTDIIKKKLQIETAWNELVFNKFGNQIKVNKNLVEEKLLEIKSNARMKKYLLSEILFEVNKENTFERTKELIYKSIDEIGFKNTANLYSVSDSSKFGGKLGWVEENKLSKKIYEQIKDLDTESVSSPIQVNNNFLIIKVNDQKEELTEINDQEIRKNIINYERDKQLQKFSKNYFDRIKINTKIDEF